MVTRRHSPKSAAPEKKGQTDREFKDRSAELGGSFDDKDRRILELSEDGLSPSEIGRAEKVGMTTGEVKARLKELAVAARNEGELEFSKKRNQNIEEVNNNFNNDLDRQIKGELPVGYIHQLGKPGDILLSTGVPDLPIELSARQLKEKSLTAHHPFNIEDIKNLPQMLQNKFFTSTSNNKNRLSSANAHSPMRHTS